MGCLPARSLEVWDRAENGKERLIKPHVILQVESDIDSAGAVIAVSFKGSTSDTLFSVISLLLIVLEVIRQRLRSPLRWRQAPLPGARALESQTPYRLLPSPPLHREHETIQVMAGK